MGVVIGVVVVIALIVAFIWYRYRLKRVARPSTGFSPPLEAGIHPDGTISSLGPGAAAVVASTKNEIDWLGNRNSGGANPSLNPIVSSTAPPSMPLQSYSASGEVNINLALQEYLILRDQVGGLAALQRTGGGLAVLNEEEGHSDHHELSSGYTTDSDEGSLS